VTVCVYIGYLFFINVFYNNTKSNVFIKLLCTHDLSRITFAAELSTNLVYNSFFFFDRL